MKNIRPVKSKEPEKNFEEDQKGFERLPAQTRELSLLKDLAEKSTGKENLFLQKKIREKSS